MMPNLTQTNPAAYGPIKILIIDDDPLFHGLIGSNAEMLGYTWQSASTLEEAMLAIKEAVEHQKPFSVVTIDMKFEFGKGEMPIGKMILQKIKSQYANLACIIISGTNISAHEVLDLRDEYGLDYYISKDRLDPDVLKRGIKKALERIRPVENIDQRRQMLRETMERYKDICTLYAHNLAIVEEKKAQKGIDVSVDVENQIKTYTTQLKAARDKLEQIKDELKRLETC